MTEYTYTGQYSYTGSFGLMFYNARWYDPSLGRFAQADSIVPPGVRPHFMGAGGLDRYAYVNNSPMNYIDPSGHICVESDGDSDVGMAGNCHGGSNPKYKPGLQGPKWNPRLGISRNENQGGGEIVSPFQAGPACTSNSCYQNSPQIGDELYYIIGHENCNSQCLSFAKGISVFATLLDAYAFGRNAFDAFVFTGLSAIPGMAGPALAAYQIDSLYINTVSTAAMSLWITNDYLLGENTATLNAQENQFVYTVSVGQDTIAAVSTNVAGWTRRDPYSSTVIDAAVLAYDVTRSPFLDQPIIPTYGNLEFSIYLPR
ncbi:MAG: RHS repeat-associated core domain-containing protein [Anaerolineales bacterium]|nr:RHS repeat-associated core domain-containing protein [Anaerolineales bacterium]